MWASVSLGALAVLVVAIGVLAVSSVATLAPVLAVAGVLLLVLPVVAWFALTTRSAWKRVLSVGMGLVAVAGLVVAALAFTLVQAGALAFVVAAAIVMRAASRRAAPVVGVTAGAERPAPARPWLLVNPWSGGGAAGRVGLVAAAEAAGFAVHVLAAGEDVGSLASGAVAAGADVLAVAGGDGTLAQVAAVAVAAGVPFLCVPAGTRNHFARDLGLDRSDPLGALRAVDGPELRIDAAFVGDRLFLNNVSLGAYADVVAEPRYRAHKLDTSRVIVRRLVRGEREPAGITVHDAGGRRIDGVQVLQVANNPYRLGSIVRFGARDRLDAGVLQISALRTRRGSALAGLAAQAAVGRLDRASVWSQWETPALTVDSDLPVLPAGIDGESVNLAPPLEFRVEPRALRVLVPAAVSPWMETRRRGQAVPELWHLAAGRR
jgi:diacylglycerol kinase family enzyme